METATNRLYYGIFGTLVVLTAVTIGVAAIHLGAGGNLALALLIASFKATLVALFFMHLKYDGKADRFLWVCVLFPVALFVIFTCAILPDIALRQGDWGEDARATAPAEEK